MWKSIFQVFLEFNIKLHIEISTNCALSFFSHVSLGEYANLRLRQIKREELGVKL